eukprot:13160199-Heterocapsa_arctica.AAC.1
MGPWMASCLTWKALMLNASWRSLLAMPSKSAWMFWRRLCALKWRASSVGSSSNLQLTLKSIFRHVARTSAPAPARMSAATFVIQNTARIRQDAQ